MLVVFAEMWASALRLDVTVHTFSKESPPVKLSIMAKTVNMQS